MPKIVSKAVCFVRSDSLDMEDFVGNLASSSANLSIRRVHVKYPLSMPITSRHDYDEYICLLKGKVDFCTSNTKERVQLHAGETLLMERGECNIRPVVCVPDTEYIQVCHYGDSRQEEESDADKEASVSTPHHDDAEILYHLCFQQDWEDAVREKRAYFPPTFRQDGMLTHATAVPSRLLQVANHFYRSSKENWICLQLSRSGLLKIGIDTLFEKAKPVGNIPSSNETTAWIFPHIYGGIPTTVDGVVTNVYDIQRDEDDGTFVSIVGLVEP